MTPDGWLSLHGLWGTRGNDAPGEAVLEEWQPGPYHRLVDLPAPVDGERADLTYARGVLVEALPVADDTRPARLSLRAAGPGRGDETGMVST